MGLGRRLLEGGQFHQARSRGRQGELSLGGTRWGEGQGQRAGGRQWDRSGTYPTEHNHRQDTADRVSGRACKQVHVGEDQLTEGLQRPVTARSCPDLGSRGCTGQPEMLTCKVLPCKPSPHELPQA